MIRSDYREREKNMASTRFGAGFFSYILVSMLLVFIYFSRHIEKNVLQKICGLKSMLPNNSSSLHSLLKGF